jgi:hypothetical protein
MADATSGPTAFLEVSRKELLQALRTMRKFGSRKKVGEALLSFEACGIVIHLRSARARAAARAARAGEPQVGTLVIHLGGLTARAAARGSWGGEAVVPGPFVANFSRSLPDADPVAVRVERGRLKIGIVSVACTWHPRVAPRIPLPVNAELPHVLRIALEHGWEEIQRAGLEDVVSEAEEKRDALIERALRVLEPLGVEYEDLWELVDSTLRRRFAIEE